MFVAPLAMLQDSLVELASAAVRLKAQAYICTADKRWSYVQLLDSSAKVRATIPVYSAFSGVKISPDGTLAVAYERVHHGGDLWETSVTLANGSGLITSLKTNETAHVAWCGKDILVIGTRSMTRWHRDEKSKTWQNHFLGDGNFSTLVEGNRYWVVQGNNLYQKVDNLDLMSIDMHSDKPVSLLAKPANLPYVFSSTENDVESSHLWLTNLQSERQTLISKRMNPYSDAVWFEKAKSLIFLQTTTKWSSARLTSYSVLTGKTTIFGPEFHIGALVAFNDDTVLLAEQMGSDHGDRVSIINPATQEIRRLGDYGRSLLGIGSCR